MKYGRINVIFWPILRKLKYLDIEVIDMREGLCRKMVLVANNPSTAVI
jgi:hypothetical protein